MVEWIGIIQKQLKLVQDTIYDLLKEHLQPKSLNRIPDTFKVFCHEKFLRAILTPSVMNNDIIYKDADELNYKIEKYLQIVW